MPTSLLFRARMPSLLLSLALLSACGGENPPTAQVGLPPASRINLPSPNLSGLPSASPVMVMPGTSAAGATEHAVRRELPGAGALTNIVLENTGSTSQRGAPFTFGQVFADGDLMPGQTLSGRWNGGNILPLQVEVKARYPNGSARHAIISAMAPYLPPGEQRSIDLVREAERTGDGGLTASTTPAALLARGFTAAVAVVIDGVTWQASADALLRAAKYKTWLAGPFANEWMVSAPLADAKGVPHPHLSARFAIRAAGDSRARVDVTLENAWAFEPAPQNFTYDAEVRVGGVTLYARPGLTHFHHARWRKVFWWGQAPQLYVRHNTAYLIATKALPNYDQSVTVAESTLAGYQALLDGARREPMGSGMAVPYMPGTGGRPDIGLLPGWAASYLLSMDKRAHDATMNTADLAGSWSAHYRDRSTDRPVSLFEYPYMTILGNRTDTVNPATNKQEAFPLCATPTACNTPFLADSSHQAGFAYLPYLLSGDYYYLEELQFWAMWNSFFNNPGYRENIKGLLQADQVRGQGWSMRTLAEAAFITPDADPFKSQFAYFIQTNLAWYNKNYTTNPQAALGVLTHGYAMAYDNGTGMAPWMDDFFTAAVGHMVELGYSEALPLLRWKARFPIARMTGNGACWINAAMYSMKLRDFATAPFYTTIGQAFGASAPTLAGLPCAGQEMANALNLQLGEMTGYASYEMGYPSNMQPALAYAADVGGPAGASAWALFVQRRVKPNYALGPQFAIIPR